MELQDHELLVRHKSGKEMVISKNHYNDNKNEFEVLTGDPGEVVSKEYKLPVPPAKPSEPTSNKEEVKPVEKTKKSLEMPKL